MCVKPRLLSVCCGLGKTKNRESDVLDVFFDVGSTRPFYSTHWAGNNYLCVEIKKSARSRSYDRLSLMIVSTVRPQNDNILIVSDKFWIKLSATSSNISNVCLKSDLNLRPSCVTRKQLRGDSRAKSLGARTTKRNKRDYSLSLQTQWKSNFNLSADTSLACLNEYQQSLLVD